MIADLTNGLFEFSASTAIFHNVFVLYRDKQVRGVSKIAAAFFLAWGIWNTFYYPHLGQMWSFIGGLFVVAANTLWVVQMLYYTHWFPRRYRGITLITFHSEIPADAETTGLEIMTHKDAPARTEEQAAMEAFWTAKLAERGTTIGWSRDKTGRYLAPLAQDCWDAWMEAKRGDSNARATN